MECDATASEVTWCHLLRGIREAFSTEKVDVDAVKSLLSSYSSKREDWEPYTKFDTHRYNIYVFHHTILTHCIYISLRIDTPGT